MQAGRFAKAEPRLSSLRCRTLSGLHRARSRTARRSSRRASTFPALDGAPTLHHPSRSTVKIDRLTSEDWERGRDVRLRALRDAPDAFSTRVEEVAAQPSHWWRAQHTSSEAATFVAVSHGRDVGLVVGAPFTGRDRTAGLFAMWVAPGARGSGVSDRLVTAVIDWARLAGYQRLLLDVGDENPAAVRLYERMGFVATGATSRLPPPRSHIQEHERELLL